MRGGLKKKKKKTKKSKWKITLQNRKNMAKRNGDREEGRQGDMHGRRPRAIRQRNVTRNCGPITMRDELDVQVWYGQAGGRRGSPFWELSPHFPREP